MLRDKNRHQHGKRRHLHQVWQRSFTPLLHLHMPASLPARSEKEEPSCHFDEKGRNPAQSMGKSGTLGISSVRVKSVFGSTLLSLGRIACKEASHPHTYLQHCFFMFRPPNLGLSRQFVQTPQSSGTWQPGHCPQRLDRRPFFTGGS